MKLAKIAISLFALQLLAGCGANPVTLSNTTTQQVSAKSTSNYSDYQAIAYWDFRDLWDRTSGCSANENPAAYHGKKYAMKAILEYEPATTFSSIRWNVWMYEPTGTNHASGFCGIVKTFFSAKQADKFYQELGAVRADDVIDGAVDPDTGERTHKQHAKADPVTVYFVYDAHQDKDITVDVQAIKTSSGQIIKI